MKIKKFSHYSRLLPFSSRNVRSTRLKFILLLAMMAATSFAQTPTAQDTYVTKKINAFMQQHHISGVAVEMYVNGKPYEYFFGYQDDAKTSPVVAKTIFEMGSISKVMTSLLLAQEVDWAKMQFTDAVSKYVKNLPKAWDKIRLQDLATHTAGLPFAPADDVQTKEELVDYANKNLTNVAAGQRWRYSNIGIGMLGVALENSTEKEFVDLYRRHILNPLQMVNGATAPKAYEKYYAQGHNKNGNVVSRETADVMVSAYGLKASAADMQHFLSAAIGLQGTPPRVFYPMRMTQSMYVKIGEEYQGLGWMIHKLEKSRLARLLNTEDYQGKGPLVIQETLPRALFNGDTLIDKNGVTNGFTAYIGVLPNKQSGIVIMANKHLRDTEIAKVAREIVFHVNKLAG